MTILLILSKCFFHLSNKQALLPTILNFKDAAYNIIMSVYIWGVVAVEHSIFFALSRPCVRARSIFQKHFYPSQSRMVKYSETKVLSRRCVSISDGGFWNLS